MLDHDKGESCTLCWLTNRWSEALNRRQKMVHEGGGVSKLRASLVGDGSSRIDPRRPASLAHAVALAETESRPDGQEYNYLYQ